MFWFVVLLLFVGAGFYFYQKMMAIEREIRAEQEIEKGQIVTVPKPENQPEESSHHTIFDSETTITPADQEQVETLSLEENVLAEVNKQPGIKQAELYLFFSDVNKKQFQQSLKLMADGGVLKREKAGSSYLLFPI